MSVLGFSWNPQYLPAGMKAVQVFDKMSAAPGDFGTKYSYGAVKIGEHWAGYLIKVRDSRAFTKKIKKDGTIIFGPETLDANEELAEGNFFVAHESNGHGLYCYHYSSASLLGDFGYVAGRIFSGLLRTEKMKVREGFKGAPKMLKDRLKTLKGSLVIEQILKPGSFNAHVKNLKEVHTLEANLVSFEMKKNIFLPLTTNARRKKISLTFDPHSPMGLLADTITKINSANGFETAAVTGIDESGSEQQYKTVNDKHIFDQWDYDQMVSVGEIKFNDIEGSLQRAPIVVRLLKTISQPNIKRMLNIA